MTKTTFRVSARGRNAMLAPTEIALADDGTAVAKYGGEPLLRYDTLDDLLRRHDLEETDLVAFDALDS